MWIFKYFFFSTIPEKEIIKGKEPYMNPTLLPLYCTPLAKKADRYPPNSPLTPPPPHPHFRRSEQQNVDIQVR